MKKLLGPDSRLVRYGTTLTSLIELNLLWLLCCLPVVTAGAATTAVYYTMYRILTGEDDAVLRPYFRAFRQNFKQATLLWLPLLVIAAVLGLDGASASGETYRCRTRCREKRPVIIMLWQAFLP